MDASAAAAAISAARSATHAEAGARRNPFETSTWTRTCADLADHPAARVVHGRDDSWSGRHRQDVRLHVSVRGSTAPLASAGFGAQTWRPRVGGEGGLLLAGSPDASCCEPRIRLSRNRPGHG